MADDDKEDKKVDASLEDGEDGAGEEDGEEGEGKKGGKKKLIIIIAAAVLLLVGGGAGAYFMGLLDPLLGGGASEEHAEDGEDHGDEHAQEGDGHGDDHGDEKKRSKKKKKGKKDDHGDGHGDDHGEGDSGSAVFLEIPNIIVNLNTEDGQPRYLRLSVQLELNSSKDKKEVEAILPRVIDQFQTYLRELRVKDLRGTAGIYRLQIELLSRVNAAAYPVEVKDVLFQEILIQ